MSRLFKDRKNKVLLIIGALFTSAGILGCATSMTPVQFNEAFPKSTDSHFYNKNNAKEEISKGNCELLVENRKYTAPIGLTLHSDLSNGARGVDEWVKDDGGNAYAINNFEWISVGDQGATQLIVYFDTMKCK